MKTKVKFVLSTLVAAAAMTNLAASAMGADIPEGYSNWNSDVTTQTAENKYITGTVKQSKTKNVYGGAINTVLNATLGESYGIGSARYTKGVVFRGALLGSATTEEKKQDAYVWVTGGTYWDKVSAVDNTLGKINYSASAGTNLNTGHMYIYGGTFNSDITGLGMAQSGIHTANTDIHILGGIENGAGMGVFGGVSGASGGSASLVGNTSVTVAGNGSTSFIAGGNRMAATSLTGNIALAVKDGGTVGGVLGGNYINELAFNTDKASTSTVNGNISISIESGNVGGGSFANGILAGGVNTNVNGDISVAISGTSVVTGGIAGGSAGWDTVSVKGSNIAISGGTINVSGVQTFAVKEVKTIFGEKVEYTSGTLSVENGLVGGNIAAAVESNATYTMTESNISIAGGKITGDVYGGGIAKTASNSLSATSKVTTATITVDASENTVVINGNIYGGGRADTANSTATVDSANIVFKGNGANLTFTGTVDGNGSGAGVCSTESSTFTFDGYSGVFSGTISNFDELVVKNNSAVTGAENGIVKIENVGKVTLKDTSTLKLETAVSSGDKLEISGGSLVEGSSVALTANASVTVTAAEGSAVTLTSVAGNVVVKAATQLDASTLSFENKDGVVLVQASDVLAVWNFVVENAETGVTVTMDVGEGQALESLRIFHEEDGKWTDVTSVVTDKELKDGKLSFTTKDFSGYMVAMPEPSMFGLMAGLGALVLVGTRRRRR